MEHTAEGQPEKPSSSAAGQSSIHAYPDWATMQAYYGPQFAMLPYSNSAVPSPHGPPPYLWVPQSMIHHYGTPYFYANGGFFRHPGAPVAGTSFSLNAQIKSGNTDGGFMKKLKEFGGLAKAVGNRDQDDTECKTDHKLSERLDSDVAKTICQTSTPVETADKKKTVLDSDDTSDYKVKKSPDAVKLSSVPTEAWMHNERELKRERRKQSNRESARRSRLRKQAEMEELAAKVQALYSESLTLKSEINKLMAASSEIRHENAALMGKLKDALKEEAIGDPNLKPDGTQNLLEKVNKNDSLARRNDIQSKRPAAKLHQLLDASHRTGPVAAG